MLVCWIYVRLDAYRWINALFVECLKPTLASSHREII